MSIVSRVTRYPECRTIKCIWMMTFDWKTKYVMQMILNVLLLIILFEIDCRSPKKCNINNLVESLSAMVNFNICAILIDPYFCNGSYTNFNFIKWAHIGCWFMLCLKEMDKYWFSGIPMHKYKAYYQIINPTANKHLL